MRHTAPASAVTNQTANPALVNHRIEAKQHEPQQFATLESVTRPAVGTAAAAFYLLRQQQTLRGWACHEDGPLRPIRINGRLAWPVSEIKAILGVKS
jgi:hypothetical protein